MTDTTTTAPEGDTSTTGEVDDDRRRRDELSEVPFAMLTAAERTEDLADARGYWPRRWKALASTLTIEPGGEREAIASLLLMVGDVPRQVRQAVAAVERENDELRAALEALTASAAASPGDTGRQDLDAVLERLTTAFGDVVARALAVRPEPVVMPAPDSEAIADKVLAKMRQTVVKDVMRDVHGDIATIVERTEFDLGSEL